MAYAAAALAVLAVEIVIAVAMTDGFVRPYLGDTLAVALVYATLLTALPLRRRSAALVALATAYAVELSQANGLVDRLGLGEVALARVVFGTYCDPLDFVAYTAALPLIALTERAASPQRAFRSLLGFRKTRRPRLGDGAAQ